MRVICYNRDDSFEALLVLYLTEGVTREGDVLDVLPLEQGARPQLGDVAVVPYSGAGRAVFQAYRKAGKPVLVLGPGYLIPAGAARTSYWRLSLNASHAPYAADAPVSVERFEALDIQLRPWRDENAETGMVLVVSSCAADRDWHRLGTEAEHALALLRELGHYTHRPLLYRPRPGPAACPVQGFEYCDPNLLPFSQILKRAALVATHSAPEAIEAVRSGVPVLVLGDLPVRELGRMRVEEVDRLREPSRTRREHFFAWLADQQWTVEELADGTAWRTLRPQLLSASGGGT